ncbi:MAG TPA: uracil-DNA glycosylase [Firmicutes bacterium]|nr:uracil-DNA glycosylase [Bacillota bacterium]
MGKTRLISDDASLLREEKLACLKRSLQECRDCALAAGRIQVVFGEGNATATIMLVGEGPGREEDRQGRPFVGAAGMLLDKILASIGFSREEVYIANVVKCRPPGNRVPKEEEATACLPKLWTQIEIINPKIIILLGATALQAFKGKDARITRERGKWLTYKGISVMPTYHPAALLRDPAKKRPVWEDMKAVRAYYNELNINTEEAREDVKKNPCG